jgi:hypothetical protein
MRLERLLNRGGVAFIVIAISSIGLSKSAGYYGTLLRGFDAQFYYAAARSAAVSGDWDVTDDLPLSPWQAPFQTEYGTPLRPDGGIKNVFPVGLSLVEAGLLVPARLFSHAFGIADEPAGYTPFEIGWVAFGLLVITAIGLQVMYTFARTLTAPSSATLIVLASWAGSPLFYQTAWFPFTSQPTTLTVMVLLLAVADRIPRSENPNRFVIAFGSLAAFLFLLRPQESPFIIILTIWRVLEVCRKGLRTWLPGTVIGLSICLAAVVFQASVHRLNLGHFRLVGHGQHDHPMISGRFDLTAPHFDIVLFSSSQGMLWTTPLALVAFAGYAFRPREIPWWGWATLINALMSLTIIAFWSDPWLGESFGIRIWSEHIPVLVCGLAVLMGQPGAVPVARRRLVGFAICTCVAWTTLLALMYVQGRLQRNMTHSQVITQAAALFGGH